MSVDQIPAEKARRSAPEAKLVGYDEYIDTQIRHTRRMVKVVDLATALAVLATGALGYLLIAAVVENWLVPGGFGTLERSLLLAVMVADRGPICLSPDLAPLGPADQSGVCGADD